MIIFQILKQNLLAILTFTALMFLIHLIYINKYQKKFNIHKEILFLLFILYIVFMFYIVTFQDASWSTSNFIPFKEIFRYNFGSRLFFKNVIGNMIMFMPFGFLINFFQKLNIKKILILTIITSLTIELMQLKIGRVFDIDDIILNIIGSLIGYIIYIFLIKNKTIIENKTLL